MAKGIIVVDIPENCAWCDCRCDTEFETYCVNSENIGEYVMKETKPEWCPIKPYDIDKVVSYIDRVANSGLGKKKSLEYVKKYVKGDMNAEK